MAGKKDISSATKLAALVSSLGGPNVSQGDIDWAMDLAAGRTLVDWLANQVATDADVAADIPDLEYQAALEAIALHEEEIQELTHASEQGYKAVEPPSDQFLPFSYSTPGMLRQSTACYEEESALLEQEAVRLNHRVNQTKIAAKQLAQTAKNLQAAISDVDEEIQRRQDRLGELSTKTDTALSKSSTAALALLRHLGAAENTTRPHDKDDIPYDDLNTLHNNFATLSVLRANIVGRTEERLQHVSTLEDAILSPDEVASSASKLHATLTKLKQKYKSDASRTELLNAAYCQEVTRMRLQLESDPVNSTGKQQSVAEIIAVLGLEDMDPAEDIDECSGCTDVDIKHELERAWTLDHAALLAARESILDEAKDRFEKELQPPLIKLHEQLSASHKQTFEAEAVIRAMLAELEEIDDDISSATSNTHDKGPTASGPSENTASELLEGELVALLKQLHGSSAQKETPLVLLDRSDLQNELNLVSTRRRAAEKAEEAWASALPAQLSAIGSTHVPMISTIYKHSPVNTSPPFSPSPSLSALKEKTRNKAEELTTAVGRLQNEVELSGRDTRKINAFVDKWTNHH